MAQYKVITLAMAVKNNRIAKFGELVDDSELTLNPSALIEGGYMEKVDEVEEKPKAQKEAEVVETKETEIEEKEEVEEVVETEKVVSKKDEVKNKLTSKK